MKLALPLLKQDRVIFLHYDDNQKVYIKELLCDEIFGEKNFVNQIMWQRTNGQQNQSHIATTTDYILVYVKKRRLNLNKNKRTLSHLKTYKFQDEHDYYRIDRIQDKKTTDTIYTAYKRQLTNYSISIGYI